MKTLLMTVSALALMTAAGYAAPVSTNTDTTTTSMANSSGVPNTADSTANQAGETDANANNNGPVGSEREAHAQTGYGLNAKSIGDTSGSPNDVSDFKATSGTGNTQAAYQQGGSNDGFAIQNGTGNVATTLQLSDMNGSGNMAGTVQQGNRNEAGTAQVGANAATTIQVNRENSSSIAQVGATNGGGQAGGGNTAFVYQDAQNPNTSGAASDDDQDGSSQATAQIGSDNTGITIQLGEINSAATAQVGQNNLAVTLQNGKSNYAATAQLGDHNSSFISQGAGTGVSFTVSYLKPSGAQAPGGSFTQDNTGPDANGASFGNFNTLSGSHFTVDSSAFNSNPALKGTSNMAAVAQFGSNNVSAVFQYGTGNNFGAYQNTQNP